MSAKYRLRCPSSVDEDVVEVLIEVLIEGRSRLSIDTRSKYTWSEDSSENDFG